jgi:tetratricopeptide (TPR) repeat protein
MTATPEDTAKWHNRLGALFYENRKYTSAEKHYHKALELMPNHTKFLFNLAIVKVSLGQRKEAIELLEKALENDQSFVEAHVNIAGNTRYLIT